MLKSPEAEKTMVEPNKEDEYINWVHNKQALVQCYCCGKREHVVSQCHFKPGTRLVS